jgi:hypothetical protein
VVAPVVAFTGGFVVVQLMAATNNIPKTNERKIMVFALLLILACIFCKYKSKTSENQLSCIHYNLDV